MTSARGGRPQKGAAITEGYNPKKTYSPAKALALKRARSRNYQARRRAELKAARLARPTTPPIPPTLSDIDDWGAAPSSSSPTEDTMELTPPADAATETGRISGTNSPSAGAAGNEATGGREEEGVGEEDGFVEDLMSDMRWVYKQLRGRDKLLELMDNDKEFLVLVKELMKLEAAYLTNKLKNRGSRTGGGFLVVLKGLEGDNKLVADMKKDKTIDLKQIERALNPTAELLGPAEEEDERMGIPPVEIIKKGLTVEQEEELQEGVKPAEKEVDW